MRSPSMRGSTRGTNFIVRGEPRDSLRISGKLIAFTRCRTFRASARADCIEPSFSAGGIISKKVSGMDGSGILSFRLITAHNSPQPKACQADPLVWEGHLLLT